MSNSKIIILLGIIIAGAMLIYYSNRPIGQTKPNAQVTEQQGIANPNWSTKTDDQASVTVTVTPLDLSAKSNEWKFDIVMDTHSVTLDQDMINVVLLVDDKGQKYKPLRWEGAPAEGHHREGVLVFSSVAPTSKSIELRISGIGAVERSFTWQP